MFSVVEDENVAGGRLCGNDARVLGHASSPIHLSLVVDLDLNLDFAWDAAKPAKLTLLIVIVGCIKLSILVGELDWSNELKIDNDLQILCKREFFFQILQNVKSFAKVASSWAAPIV